MTVDDFREHDESPDCWCEPELYFVADNGAEVWLHHDPNESLPSPAVIARSIAMAWNQGYAEPATKVKNRPLSWIEKMILRLTRARNKRRER